MRNKKGFTLAELLITIGILSVLLALGGLAVLQYVKTKAITEADSAAKSIYLAAQNQLTAKVASGEWEELKESHKTDSETFFGEALPNAPEDLTEKQKENWNTVKSDYSYLIYNKGNDIDSSTALGEMVPFGSVDDDLRKGGSYVIEYNKKTGTVYGVFYTFEQKTGASLSYNTDITPLNNNNGRTDKEVRKDPKNKISGHANALVIGYYGGSMADSLPADTLAKPEIEFENTNKLTVKIKDENTHSSKSSLGAKLGITITGETSGAKAELDSNGNMDITKTDGNKLSSLMLKTNPKDESNQKIYTMILDDITIAGGHFADIFKGGVANSFIPGENLMITVMVTATNVLATPVEATAYTNSLYETVVPIMEKTTGTVEPKVIGQEAVVTCARHLQNLSADVSNVPIDKGNANAVLKASQTKDVDWEDFVKDVKTDEGFIIDEANTNPRTQKSKDAFCGITNDSIREYNGNGNTLSNFNIELIDKSAAGLFASIGKNAATGADGTSQPAMKKDFTVSNLNIKGMTCTAKNDAAGVILGKALAGSSLTAKNITVIDAAVSTKNNSAGGIVGRIEGTDDNAAGTQPTAENETKSQLTAENVVLIDTIVTTEKNNAGGILGKAVNAGTLQVTDAIVMSPKVRTLNGYAGGVFGKLEETVVAGTKITVLNPSVTVDSLGSAGGVAGLLEKGTLNQCAVYMEGDAALSKLKKFYLFKMGITDEREAGRKSAADYYRAAALAVKTDADTDAEKEGFLGTEALDKQVHIFVGGEEQENTSGTNTVSNNGTASNSIGQALPVQNVSGETPSLRMTDAYNVLQKLSSRINLEEIIHSMTTGTVRNDTLSLQYPGTVPSLASAGGNVQGTGASSGLLAAGSQSLSLKSTDNLAQNSVSPAAENITQAGASPTAETELLQEILFDVKKIDTENQTTTKKANLPVSGGLVGVVRNGSAGTADENEKNNVIIKHSFASVPTAVDKEGYAGGLIGHIGKKTTLAEDATEAETTISHCYTGGYTDNGEYSITDDEYKYTTSYYGVVSVKDKVLDREDGFSITPFLGSGTQSASSIIPGTSVAGGLIGVDSSKTTVKYCYSTAAVYGDTAGGLIGDTPSGSYRNCYAAGKVGPANEIKNEDILDDPMQSTIRRGAFFGAKGMILNSLTLSDCVYLKQYDDDEQQMQCLDGSDVTGLEGITYGKLEGKPNYWEEGDETFSSNKEEATYSYDNARNQKNSQIDIIYPFPMTTTTGYPKLQAPDGSDTDKITTNTGERAAHYGDWESNNAAGLVYYEKTWEHNDYYRGYLCKQNLQTGAFDYKGIKKSGSLPTAKRNYVVEDGYLLLLPKDKYENTDKLWIESTQLGDKTLNKVIKEFNDEAVSKETVDSGISENWLTLNFKVTGYDIYYLKHETPDGSQPERLSIKFGESEETAKEIAAFMVNTKFASSVQKTVSSDPAADNVQILAGDYTWKVRSVRHLVNMGQLADGDNNLPNNCNFSQEMDIDFQQDYRVRGQVERDSKGNLINYADIYKPGILQGTYSAIKNEGQTDEVIYSIAKLTKSLFAGTANEKSGIKGVRLEKTTGAGVHIEGSALISGTNKGTVENCVVDNCTISLSGTDFTDLGESKELTLSNGNKCTVSDYACGGMIGINEGTVISCKINNSTIQESGKKFDNYDLDQASTKAYYIGGFAGKNKGTIENCIIKDSNLNGTLCQEDKKYKAIHLAGIAGKNESKIKNCNVTSTDIKGNAATAGIVIDNIKASAGAKAEAGDNTESYDATKANILNCHVKGCNIDAADIANNKAFNKFGSAGIAITNENGIVKDCSIEAINGKGSVRKIYSGSSSANGLVISNSANGSIMNCNVTGISIKGLVMAEGVLHSNSGTISNCNVNGVKVIVEGLDGGMAEGVCFSNSGKLSYINVSGTDIKSTNGNAAGIFMMNTGLVEHCKVSNCNVEALKNASGVGINSMGGTLSDINVYGDSYKRMSINADTMVVSGVIYFAMGTNIEKVTFTGSLSGKTAVTGFVYTNSGSTISDCYVNAIMSSSVANVYGFVSINSGDISNSFVTGSMVTEDAGNKAGTIYGFGDIKSGIISNCYVAPFYVESKSKNEVYAFTSGGNCKNCYWLDQSFKGIVNLNSSKGISITYDDLAAMKTGDAAQFTTAPYANPSASAAPWINYAVFSGAYPFPVYGGTASEKMVFYGNWPKNPASGNDMTTPTNKMNPDSETDTAAEEATTSYKRKQASGSTTRKKTDTTEASESTTETSRPVESDTETETELDADAGSFARKILDGDSNTGD